MYALSDSSALLHEGLSARRTHGRHGPIFMTKSADAAVLLVAGIGSRLRPLTNDVPKALVQVGSTSILERAVRALRDHGVQTFVFATGYCCDSVESVVKGWGIDAHFCLNEAYQTTQNSISLLRCAGALKGKSFFKLDGDLLFVPSVLERLSEIQVGLSVAVDGMRVVDEEAMKVQVDPRRRIENFGKHLPVAASSGESIGIERLDAATGHEVLSAIGGLESRGIFDRYYEDVYATLIADGRIEAQAVEVGDLPWTEVDCQEDLVRARALFQD